jgi:cytochrome c oxidase subunit 3
MSESSDTPVVLGEQFDTPEQQDAVAQMGMWVFLSTEIMLFGGLFLAFTATRLAFPLAFQLGSRHTEFVLGTANTAVLLLSSLTMALAVSASHRGARKPLVLLLLLTMALGALFLGIKGYEYYGDWQKHLIPGANFAWNEPQPQHAQLFFLFYFFMTGLHAVHLTVGIGVVAFVTFVAWRRGYDATYNTPVEVTGLYWHLVDLVWVFLYPLLYLNGRHP